MCNFALVFSDETKQKIKELAEEIDMEKFEIQKNRIDISQMKCHDLQRIQPLTMSAYLERNYITGEITLVLGE